MGTQSTWGSAVSSTASFTSSIQSGGKHNNTSAKMMKFALLCVLLAVATYSVESKKFYGYGAYGYGGVIAPAYGYGLGGCIDTLSGCGGYVSLGYCGQAYYSNGCALSCGICKK